MLWPYSPSGMMNLLPRRLGVLLARVFIWQSSLGEPLLVQGHTHPQGSVHPEFFAGRGVLPRPSFLQLRQQQGPSQLQSSTEPREWLRNEWPYFSFLPPKGVILKTLPNIHPAHKSVSGSPSQRTYLEAPSFSLRSTIFLLIAFLEMRIEIICKMQPYFRNVQIEKMCFVHSRKLCWVHEGAVIACCMIMLAVTNNPKQLQDFHRSHYLKEG